MEAAPSSKSPGLDRLNYECYKTVFDLSSGCPCSGRWFEWDEVDLVGSSLCQDVELFLCKVMGVLMASQLRPITLLNTDQKLLPKVFVNNLLGVLPSVLQKDQLLSVKGKNILQGPSSCGPIHYS